ncbi:hypothetical protein [Thalassotalea agarivorans]|uniref:Uncharacterized protein n=1 Tax=Thalassotalea agarivorans TaxID=349064 RepID=A0A1I0F1U6_THASX|nr:hypothetical protein [Thalassotalea agarivorans]SET51337.1 hypothetical protein SAMN05660429_02014 [Thalassotalea agarivorans]
MGKASSSLVVENENLFRALVCAPVALLFVALAVDSIATSGIVIFQVLFVLIAMYFALYTLAYAAYYTDERLSGKAQRLFKNINLSKALFSAPFALLFTGLTVFAIQQSIHIVFIAILMLIAIYYVLATLAYAAYYTNDLSGH